MLLDEKPPIEGIYIAHFGVRGMKWGQRKAEPSGGSSTSSSASTSNAKMSRNKKIAIGVAITAGALTVAAIMRKRGQIPLRPKSGAASTVESLLGKANEPSPFKMQLDAGAAAHRNMMSRMANQTLTDKTWRDAAKLSQMSRATSKGKSVTDMSDLTANFMNFTDAALRQGGAR